MEMRKLSIVLGLALAGCGPDGDSSGDSPPVFPGLPPAAVMTVNSFSMIPMGPVQDGAYKYTWFTSAGQANLTIGGISGGSVRIQIRDDGAATVHDNVYTGGLIGEISAMTSPDGVSGVWSLCFTFQGVTAVGAIDIRGDVHDEPDDIVISGAYSLQSTYEYEAGWDAGPAKAVLASAISLGTVRIRMWDGASDLVMDRTNLGIVIGAFNGESNHGAAGTWKIRIDIDAVATAGAITIGHPATPTGRR